MKLRITFLTFAAAASFFVGTLSVAQNERFDHKVRNDFFAGFTGNQEALARGMKVAEETLAVNPSHAEALVWHGAGLYYQAGMLFMKGDNERAMPLVMKGIAEMDKAVALAPDNLGVRIPRGAALMASTRFQQGPHVAAPLDRAVSDYQRAYDIQEAELDKLGTHPKGELLLGLADGLARTGKTDRAKALYERTAKEMPGTPYEKSAKEWLETGKLSAEKAGCLGCHAGK